MLFLEQCRTSCRRSSSVFRLREVRKRRSTPYVNLSLTKSDYPKIIVKLDMMNALNSVRRDHVLQKCLDRTPEIARLSFLAYIKPSSVIASGHSITSSTGVQQGDPIGLLLFAPAVYLVIMIIIIMVISMCYFSREHIALSHEKWCEHRIRKNQQIKSTAHDGKSYLK